MPSETARHDRTWMAFPPEHSALDDTPRELDEARVAWSEVAHAVIDFEPLTMVVDPADLRSARRYLSAEIDIVEAPLNDAWMRDIGPTFVHDEHGAVAAVDWVFNGWGQQEWARWDKDARVADAVIRHSGVQAITSPLVNEGGGIHVDGFGTVLLTDTVQLDPMRNPGATHESVEAELERVIGTTHAIWLPRGLTRDAQRLGTRGHIDIVATIAEPGVVLVHSQANAAHPDFVVSRDIRERLAKTTDARGQEWRIVQLPAPEILRDREGWVDYSYVNHLVVNDGVISCGFADPADDRASGLLADAYPGREVRQIDARPIFARGGGIHCITQQQPSRRSA